MYLRRYLCLRRFKQSTVPGDEDYNLHLRQRVNLLLINAKILTLHSAKGQNLYLLHKIRTCSYSELYNLYLYNEDSKPSPTAKILTFSYDKDYNLSYSFSVPDSFFTDPDPGFFPQSGSGSRQQKTNFSKAKTKFWEKFLF